MKFSVIIPCYNAAETIGSLLESLVCQELSEPWEVIVSDNGSTDGSTAIVESYRDRLSHLRLVDASDKRRTAHARNVGVQAARGESLLFIDADDQAADDWLQKICAALKKHDVVASRFDIEKLNDPWVQESHMNPLKDGLKAYNYPPTCHIQVLPSGLGVRRSIYDASGGFDESIRILEDTDFCWRIQLAGTKLYFVPGAVVHYRYRNTIRDLFLQARAYAEDNVLLYKKYRPLGMPKLSWEYCLRDWKGVLRLLPRIRTMGEFVNLVWRFGWRIGRLQGCIKYRVFAP